MSTKARNAREAVRLEQIPNIGKSVAGDLRGIGIEKPTDLVGHTGYELYDAVCTATGVKHDPCLLDTFLAAVDFMNGAPSRPWWHYTPQRKKALANAHSS